MSVKIEYPVLRLAPRTILPFRDAGEVHVCAAKVLKTGYFSDYRLIDSLLRSFRATKVNMIRYKPPFWGWRLLEPRLAEIEIEFETPVQLSLTEVHDIVMTAVRSESDIWEESWPDLDELEEKIRASKSISAMADLLDPQPASGADSHSSNA